jgi:hypothetical protein
MLNVKDPMLKSKTQNIETFFESKVNSFSKTLNIHESYECLSCKIEDESREHVLECVQIIETRLSATFGRLSLALSLSYSNVFPIYQ